MTTIKRVGVLSVGLIFAGISLFWGLLAGLMLFAMGSMGAAMAAAQGEQMQMPGLEGLVTGAGFLVILIIYPIMGFIGGIISALVFNLVAMVTGGIKVELQQ